jgi:hypothetical protein
MVRCVRVLQRLFSFPATLCSLLTVLTVLTVRERLVDPDLWWHLKMGQVIFVTHHIPTRDLFSYTARLHRIVPQEWLSELSIYSVYKLGGYAGLMLLFSLLASTLVVAGYLLCRMYSGNAKVAFVGAMMIWFFGTIGFEIRPQMFSYILLVVELMLIYAGRTRNPRWFLCLPLLFLIWINSHASFIVGIAVACAYLIGSFIEFDLGILVSRRWDLERRRIFAWSIALSCAALFVNPVGFKQVLYPFDNLMNMQTMIVNVEEWAPLNLTEARGIGVLAVLLCIALLIAARKAEIYLDELLVLAAGAWLAFEHTRMMILFGILAAPTLCRQLANVWENYEPEKDRILPNAVLIGISIVIVVLAFPSRQNLERQVESTSPVKAVQYIKANQLSGHMLNDYTYGGYLIWAAPEYPVMMDGRADLYEWTGFLEEYAHWAKLEEDPNLLLEKYNVNFCLLSTHSQMTNVLPLLRDWKLVYSDDLAKVFVRTPAQVNTATAVR